jgi:aminoglycoside N3'-acetyltransferase
MRPPHPVSEVTEQLKALGVMPGITLAVHSSYRALRPVEGGPAGLLEALRGAVGPEGTLTMPSWTDSDEEPFHPETTPSLHLGVLTDTFWRQPGVLRNDHPNAFAAQGPLARTLLADPLPLPPHIRESPIGRVWELDGWVLLLGVGHDANTLIHLAELLAKVPYGIPKHCLVLRGGQRERIPYVENDHCCARFCLLDGWLRERGLQQEGPVAEGHARLVRARDVVDTASEQLRADPTVFLHPRGSGCAECAEAWATV